MGRPSNGAKNNFRNLPLGSLDCYHFDKDKMRMHMNQNDPISASCSNNERYEGKRQLFPQFFFYCFLIVICFASVTIQFQRFVFMKDIRKQQTISLPMVKYM